MKPRFLLFMYDEYEAGGGWRDFENAYWSIEDAVLDAPVRARIASCNGEDYTRAQIVDLETFAIVRIGHSDLLGKEFYWTEPK